MKILFAILLLEIAIHGQLEKTVDLTVKIPNIQILEGKVMVALFNSKETYFKIDQMYAGIDIPVDSSIVFCTFKALPIGTYALTIYHDEDSNGEMNRNWLGMPTEGYAFSNNFSSPLRPASFSDASFKLENDTTLVLKMNY